MGFYKREVLGRQHATWTQEAPEEVGRAQVMDAGQTWRCVHREAQLRPPQAGESLPVVLFLRNRLKYAITMKEVETIMKQRLIKIDGKTRTDPKFPTGFMDVVQIDKTGENLGSSTTSRGASPCTGSPPQRPPTSSAG